MSRGKRYEEPKLNLKKVFAVILAIVVIIMFIFGIRSLLSSADEQGKIASIDYFAAFQDNKWGVIDSSGNVVIDPAYEEMIVIPNSKNDVFLCTYDVNYDTGEYKTKALNSKNEEIFTNYSQIEAISNTDESNNLWYESNMLKVQNNGKYGLIDLTGKELLACEYDEISVIPSIEGVLKVQKDGKYGIVNSEGKITVPTQYTDITNLGDDSTAGYIVKNDEGKAGIVTSLGEVVLEPNYDDITKVHANDMYVVVQGGKQILVQKDGTEVLSTGYEEITEVLKNTDNGVIFKNQNQYGIMKTTGEVTIPESYEELKEAKTGIYIAKQNGKYGIIDITNSPKVEFKYANITYQEKADIYIAQDENYNDDIINNNFEVAQSGILVDYNEEKGYIELRQNDEYKYYNFQFEEKQEKDFYSSNTLFLSKKDGKYGFVDKDGNVVVEYNYDDATNQNTFGYAGVKKDGKWGVVDREGKVVQEPTYELDDYLKIDFIGRWHLGRDLNMNYYNQL